jgi:hypothetical protein
MSGGSRNTTPSRGIRGACRALCSRAITRPAPAGAGNAGRGTLRVSILGVLLVFTGCATVHQEDLDAWGGRPVSDLEKHPILVTFPAVRTMASDGTEIRDYVNGKTVSQCSSGGTVFAGYVSMATYSGFTNCMQNFAACHGIFYIKNGVIDHVSAIGTGGTRCYTDASLRPTFSGSANIR